MTQKLIVILCIIFLISCQKKQQFTNEIINLETVSRLQQYGEFKCKVSNLENLIFSSNSEFLIAVTVNGDISVFDIKRSRRIKKFNVGHKIFHSTFDIRYDNIIVSGDNRELTFWDLEGNFVNNYSTDKSVGCISISDDGKQLAIGYETGIISIFDLNNMEKIYDLVSDYSNPSNVVFSPSGDKLVAYYKDSDGKVLVWDLNNKVICKDLTWLSGKRNNKDFKFTANGVNIIGSYNSYMIISINVNTGKYVNGYVVHDSTATHIRVNGNNNIFASAGLDQNVILWNIETRDFLEMYRNDVNINCLNFSPDGKYFSYGLENGIIRVFAISENYN